MKKKRITIIACVIMLSLLISGVFSYIYINNAWKTNLDEKQLSLVQEYVSHKGRCEEIQIDFLIDYMGVFVKEGYNTIEVKEGKFGDIVSTSTHIGIYLGNGYVLSGNDSRHIRRLDEFKDYKLLRWDGINYIDVSCDYVFGWGYEDYGKTLTEEDINDRVALSKWIYIEEIKTFTNKRSVLNKYGWTF